MGINLRKLGILLGIAALFLIGVTLLAFSYTDIGIADLVGEEASAVTMADFSDVPESVAEDAVALAMELYGDYHDKYTEFVNQLLIAYAKAKDKDFVVIFNAGGWGSDLLESSPGWHEICRGITDELGKLGYSSLILDYHRTAQSIWAFIKEFVEAIADYPSKAKVLASRVEFLTEHIPDVKIIVAGESSGAVIADRVMDSLRDNPRVFSIQTGTPFWHRRETLERTLALDDNGIRPDSFARGDILTIIWSSLKALVGLSPPEGEDPGRILYFMHAPGHDYRWEYPGVYSKITQFLRQNFGLNQDIPSN